MDKPHITESVKLEFAQSTSQTVGFKGRAVEYLRANADRVFSQVNASGDAILITLTAMDPNSTALQLTVVALYFLANGPLLFSGDKKQTRAESQAEWEEMQGKSWVKKMAKKAAKPFTPRKHPVECYSAITCTADACFAYIGISGLSQQISPESIMTTLLGVLGITSTLTQIFAPSPAEIAAKEATKLLFAESAHQVVDKKSIIEKTKNWALKNPAKIVAGTAIAASLNMLGAGIAGNNWGFIVAGSTYVAAYSVYSAFVRREAAPVVGTHTGNLAAQAHQAPAQERI